MVHLVVLRPKQTLTLTLRHFDVYHGGLFSGDAQLKNSNYACVAYELDVSRVSQ
ncbi:hypothetical protein [Staphylococcus delphini]|uniref:hypothetical protein n=1 Tax=Staphylococcus delphini TaxID=53344 RepID=UPI0015C70553|nr:hypothetical protein [Staphylococcus delphini]